MKWSSRIGGTPGTGLGAVGLLRTALAPATDGPPALRFPAPPGLWTSPNRSLLSLSPGEC
ncbi:hypothetical protein D7294_14880 [Streptomyces hoynatensis]|uniref:Uncharacterized protein n=1 Tax=Streptomyces hoynatensis TaxID=1141874 RepID=A0A3A9Z142_9ACTN|nr:hypothetical protein D7294_14880 [Streptomyces hoynatensis]